MNAPREGNAARYEAFWVESACETVPVVAEMGSSNRSLRESSVSGGTKEHSSLPAGTTRLNEAKKFTIAE